jgi:hypothetical protein
VIQTLVSPVGLRGDSGRVHHGYSHFLVVIAGADDDGFRDLIVDSTR